MQPGSVPLHQLLAAEAALDHEHARKVTWRAWAFIWFGAFAVVAVCLAVILTGGAE
jgi:hypothetical protein